MTKKQLEDRFVALAVAAKELAGASSPSDRYPDDKPDVVVDGFDDEVRHCIRVGDAILKAREVGK